MPPNEPDAGSAGHPRRQNAGPTFTAQAAARAWRGGGLGAGRRPPLSVLSLGLYTDIGAAHVHPSPHPAPPASVRPARPVARRLPLGRRDAPAKLARVEAVAEREIDVLLAQPDFQELLEALAEMAELPEEERLRQLERMAWCVLEMALADSDWRAAALNIADQMRRGCHPARSLAKAVIAAQARAAAPPPDQPKPARPHRSRPYDPVDAAMGRAASGLRATLGLEAALAHLPEPKSAEPNEAPAASQPVTAPSEQPRQAPPRQCPARRLCAGTAARPRDAVERHRRGPLRAWAQGP